MINAYFVNVGQGNMVVVVFPDNFVVAYDCNITNANAREVFRFLGNFMPKRAIDVFVNSHREADHMRGLRRLHAVYPISVIWDSGVSANVDTIEYQDYMRLRREIGFEVVRSQMYLQNRPAVRVLNGRREGLNDANAQSIVLHIDESGSGLLLAGDTNSASWRDYIIREYGATLRCLVLYASHHGSYAFINDNPDFDRDFTAHLQLMRPAVTLISVSGTNPHGHPHPRALAYYEHFSHGTLDTGERVFRTDLHGNMCVQLHGQGTGTLYWGL